MLTRHTAGLHHSLFEHSHNVTNAHDTTKVKRQLKHLHKYWYIVYIIRYSLLSFSRVFEGLPISLSVHK